MKKPEFGDNKWRKSCRKIVAICESDWFKHLIRHVFFVAPPAVAVWVLEGANGVDLETKLGSFGSFLERSALMVLIGAWIWVALCKSVYAIIRHYAKPKRELSRDQVLAILQAIYGVVAPKAHRMREHAHRFGQYPRNAGEVFKSITQPEEQLKLLTSAVHGLF